MAVHESLPGRASNGGCRPLRIRRVPKPPTETKLFAVQRHVLVAHMVEGPVNTPLEEGEVGLGGVRAHVALYVLAGAVLVITACPPSKSSPMPR